MSRYNPSRQRAREAYAAQLDRKGSAWKNTANNVRAGYENVWIELALDALELALIGSGDDEPEGDESGRA